MVVVGTVFDDARLASFAMGHMEVEAAGAGVLVYDVQGLLEVGGFAEDTGVQGVEGDAAGFDIPGAGNVAAKENTGFIHAGEATGECARGGETDVAEEPLGLIETDDAVSVPGAEAVVVEVAAVEEVTVFGVRSAQDDGAASGDADDQVLESFVTCFAEKGAEDGGGVGNGENAGDLGF